MTYALITTALLTIDAYTGDNEDLWCGEDGRVVYLLYTTDTVRVKESFLYDAQEARHLSDIVSI